MDGNGSKKMYCTSSIVFSEVYHGISHIHMGRNIAVFQSWMMGQEYRSKKTHALIVTWLVSSTSS